jgi:integrase
MHIRRASTGHVRLVQRKSGPVWYARWRRPDGNHGQKKLGPAWTKRG